MTHLCVDKRIVCGRKWWTHAQYAIHDWAKDEDWVVLYDHTSVTCPRCKEWLAHARSSHTNLPLEVDIPNHPVVK